MPLQETEVWPAMQMRPGCHSPGLLCIQLRGSTHNRHKRPEQVVTGIMSFLTVQTAVFKTGTCEESCEVVYDINKFVTAIRI